MTVKIIQQKKQKLIKWRITKQDHFNINITIQTNN